MSLFLIEGSREWKAEQQQALFLGLELAAKGYPLQFVVHDGSALHGRLREKGLPVLPMRVGNGRSLSARLKLAGSMKRRRTALVHFLDVRGLEFGSAAASWARVPVRVLSRRADFPSQSPQKLLRDTDAVIAASEGVKTVLVRGGIPEGLVEVVPNGIDFSPFRTAGPDDFLRQEFSFAPDDFLVGMVASLEDQKGYTNIRDAAGIVRLNAPRIRIVIIGEGSLRIEAEDPKDGDADGGVVYYLGFSANARRILASLDVFVMASSMEGLGTPLLEAMAGRLPVVATQVGRVPELVVHRETGLLVPPRRPKPLADAILKLYMDRKLAGRLGGRAAEVVEEKFSAEAMARRVVGIYEKAAARKGIKLV